MYLGHIFSSKGIASSNSLSYPQNTKVVKQFMGISNYYRYFIPAYVYIAELLHHLFRKSSKTFQWTKQCEASFNTLKSKLTYTYLTFPKLIDPFMVSTDASNGTIGEILSQIQDGHERVIVYWSRQLTKAERNY